MARPNDQRVYPLLALRHTPVKKPGGNHEWLNLHCQVRRPKGGNIQSNINSSFQLPQGKLAWMWKTNALPGKMIYTWCFFRIYIYMLVQLRVTQNIETHIETARQISCHWCHTLTATLPRHTKRITSATQASLESKWQLISLSFADMKLVQDPGNQKYVGRYSWQMYSSLTYIYMYIYIRIYTIHLVNNMC